MLVSRGLNFLSFVFENKINQKLIILKVKEQMDKTYIPTTQLFKDQRTYCLKIEMNIVILVNMLSNNMLFVLDLGTIEI